MAARENQGYLIAVIILVLLTVILALAAFLGISKAREYADVRDDVTGQLALQKNLTKAYETQNEILRAYIGDFGPSVALVQTQIDSLGRLVDPNFDENQKKLINDVITRTKEVQTEYEKDMKQFIASEAEDESAEDKTWRSLTRNLAAVLNQKHLEADVLRNEVTRVQREAEAEIEARDTVVAETKKSLETARTELQTEKDRFEKQAQSLNNTITSITKENQNSGQALKKAREAFQKSESDYEGQIAEVKKQNISLKSKVDRYEKEVFDLPDGQIVKSSPGIRLVHIDLGSADGLRTSRKFAVYDQSETNFLEGKHKATIEITDINGQHQSVARIIEDDPLNPILKGDYVLTATWDPGYRVPIALVGIFDLDNDGTSDRERLVNMIEQNGGIVVAQHDEEGNVIGKIDSSTRYLVLGDEPKVGPNSNPQILDAIKKLMDQGSANQVQEIDLKKLLNWMGLHGQAKIERLDSHIGDEFRKRDPKSSLKSRKR